MSAPRGTPKFSTREAIRFGWRAARRNFGFFVTMLLVTSIVDGIPGHIQRATLARAPLVAAVAGLLGAIIGLVTTIGWTKVLLRIVDGERPSHTDLYAHHALLFKYLGVGVLYMLSLAVGVMLFLTVPGIMAVVRFGFILLGILATLRYSMAPFLVVDRGIGPVEAMRKSAEITQGEQWHILVAGVALLALVLLGVAALLIGLLWTFPAAMVAWAFIYRRLSPRERDARTPVPVPVAVGPKEWWAASR